MKKLGYLALMLITILALGSCVLYSTPLKNYISVDWTNEPKNWNGNNRALPDSSIPATSTQLSNISWFSESKSGSFYFTYTDDLDTSHTVRYTIPPNTSDNHNYYILYIGSGALQEGLYVVGDESDLSVRTVK